SFASLENTLFSGRGTVTTSPQPSPLTERELLRIHFLMDTPGTSDKGTVLSVPLRSRFIQDIQAFLGRNCFQASVTRSPGTQIAMLYACGACTKACLNVVLAHGRRHYVRNPVRTLFNRQAGRKV